MFAIGRNQNLSVSSWHFSAKAIAAMEGKRLAEGHPESQCKARAQDSWLTL